MNEDVSIVVEWEDLFVSPLKFISQASRIQQRFLCSTHKHSWEIHALVHLEVGVLELLVEVEQRKNRDGGRWCILASAVAPGNIGSGGGVRVQPPHYGSVKGKRGRSCLGVWRIWLLPLYIEAESGSSSGNLYTDPRLQHRGGSSHKEQESSAEFTNLAPLYLPHPPTTVVVP